MTTIYFNLDTALPMATPMESIHLSAESLICEPFIDAAVFWQNLAPWLDSSTPWTVLKIDDREIPRHILKKLSLLAIPLTPQHIPTILDTVSEETIDALLESKVYPIVYAVFLGDTVLVEQLLDQGASLDQIIAGKDAKIFQNRSLLDVAWERNQDSVYHLLLSRGAKVLWSTDLNALKKKPDLLHELIKHSPDFLDSHSSGEDRPVYFEWASEGNLEELQFWSNLGICFHRCGIPLNILNTAIQTDQIETVQWLLAQGFQPILGLWEAAKGGHTEILLQLIDFGIKTNDRFAEEVFEVLLNRVYFQDFEPISKILNVLPFPLPCRDGVANNALFTLSALPPEDFDRCLQSMLQDRSPEVVIVAKEFLQYLFAARTAAVSNPRADFFQIPLHPKDQELILILLKRVPDLLHASFDGLSAMHCAALAGEEIALKALELGGDPHACTSTGITLLHLAALKNLRTFAEALLDRGVNPDKQDYTGSTPLDHAATYLKTDCITKLFLERKIHSANPLYLYINAQIRDIDWLPITETPALRSAWEEISLNKLCAHVFGINDFFHLHDDLIFSREGMSSSPRWLIEQIGKCTQQMSAISQDEEQWKETIASMCAFTSKDSHLSDADYLELIIQWVPDPLPRLLSLKQQCPAQCLETENPFGLPQNLWRRLVLLAGIPEKTPLSRLSKASLQSLANLCSAHSFTIEGKTTYKHEFVTCGGVDLREIDFRRMESRLVPGLYFAGEILNIDGLTGGFNLQNAWTSGWIAGVSMAQHN